MEDKKGIIRAFSLALMQTRAGSDIGWMDYRKENNYEEYVDIYYSKNNVKHINVTADSGAAMMLDVLNYIL